MTSWKLAPVACSCGGCRAGPHRSPSRWPPRCRPRDRLSLVGRLRRPRRARFATVAPGVPLGSGRALLRTPRPNTSSNSYAPISPKNWASRRPAVDPPRRRRTDPEGIRSRSGGADRRPVSGSQLGLHGPSGRAVTPVIKDPEEVRQWLEETYPAIEARANREGAGNRIGVDEVGVAARPTALREAMRRGGKPRPRMCRTRTSERDQISTITNHGEVRFMTYTQTMTAALFLVFLGRLLQEHNRGKCS